MAARYQKRIVIDPRIMVRKPIIKGTRITIDAIIRRLAEGMTITEILEDYPKLTREDVQAALEYCVHLINGEDIVPLTPR
jgi:uncharacterized protein (DUF433 family)